MRKLIIALAAAMLFLTGCSVSVGNKTDSKSSDGPSASVSQAPAGKTITGKGYSFTAPEGWEDIQKEMGDQFDAAARESGQTDGFADNINVITAGSSGITLEKLKESIEGQLKAAGGKNIKILDDIKIDGVPAAHAQAEIPVPNKAGLIAHTNQFYIVREDGEFLITITSEGGFDDPKTQGAVARILNSWKWQ